MVNGSYPEFEIVWYGHIGDGNLHLNVLKPDAMAMDEFQQRCAEVSKRCSRSCSAMVAVFPRSTVSVCSRKTTLQYSRSELESVDHAPD